MSGEVWPIGKKKARVNEKLRNEIAFYRSGAR